MESETKQITTTEQKQIHRHREQTSGCQRGGSDGGVKQMSEI